MAMPNPVMLFSLFSLRFNRNKTHLDKTRVTEKWGCYCFRLNSVFMKIDFGTHFQSSSDEYSDKYPQREVWPNTKVSKNINKIAFIIVDSAICVIPFAL